MDKYLSKVSNRIKGKSDKSSDNDRSILWDLPKLDTVEYFLQLPIKVEVKYRPFNVKEQKVLLQAIEEKAIQKQFLMHSLV